MVRSSRPEVFLEKAVLKIWSKFTGEHPCRSVISIKLQSNFNEIALRHGCSPVNLQHISRTPFPRNTSGWLLLDGPGGTCWNYRNKPIALLILVEIVLTWMPKDSFEFKCSPLNLNPFWESALLTGISLKTVLRMNCLCGLSAKNDLLSLLCFAFVKVLFRLSAVLSST